MKNEMKCDITKEKRPHLARQLNRNLPKDKNTCFCTCYMLILLAKRGIFFFFFLYTSEDILAGPQKLWTVCGLRLGSKIGVRIV